MMYASVHLSSRIRCVVSCLYVLFRCVTIPLSVRYLHKVGFGFGLSFAFMINVAFSNSLVPIASVCHCVSSVLMLGACCCVMLFVSCLTYGELVYFLG